MPRIDANPQVPERPELAAADLPRAWAGHPETSPLRALDFWVGGEELDEGLDQAELFYTDPAA